MQYQNNVDRWDIIYDPFPGSFISMNVNNTFFKNTACSNSTNTYFQNTTGQRANTLVLAINISNNIPLIQFKFFVKFGTLDSVFWQYFSTMANNTIWHSGFALQPRLI